MQHIHERDKWIYACNERGSMGDVRAGYGCAEKDSGVDSLIEMRQPASTVDSGLNVILVG